MRADKRKYHYLYRVTCIPTFRYYWGMHSTDHLEDGYKGSGKILWFSFRNHGLENHRFEIIKFFNSREELRTAEKAVIAESLEDKLCMNLRQGGEGGWDFVNRENRCPLHRPFSQRTEEQRERALEWLERSNASPKRTNREKNLGSGMLGKKHSPETIEKLRESHRGPNGQMWLTNELTGESKRFVREEALRLIFSKEWRVGRKIHRRSASVQAHGRLPALR